MHADETIDFAMKLPTRLVSFHLPVPCPGTELHDQCRGGICPDAKWSDYSSRDFKNPVYLNHNFKKDTFDPASFIAEGARGAAEALRSSALRSQPPMNQAEAKGPRAERAPAGAVAPMIISIESLRGAPPAPRAIDG